MRSLQKKNLGRLHGARIHAFSWLKIWWRRLTRQTWTKWVIAHPIVQWSARPGSNAKALSLLLCRAKFREVWLFLAEKPCDHRTLLYIYSENALIVTPSSLQASRRRSHSNPLLIAIAQCLHRDHNNYPQKTDGDTYQTKTRIDSLKEMQCFFVWFLLLSICSNRVT